MNSIMKIQYVIGTLAAAFLLASCSNPKEEENDGYRLSYGKVDVTVSVSLADPVPVKVSTRALTESDIKNMDLLIFDENAQFMERVKLEGKQLDATESGVAFTVQLDATQQKRIIHLVANGRSDLDEDRLNFKDLVTGTLESPAISSLMTVEMTSIQGMTAAGTTAYLHDVMPLVMWGRLVLEDGTNSGKAVQVQLLRATARIQVQKGLPTAANGLDQFSLYDISIPGAASRGFLAPADCTGASAMHPTTGHPVTNSGYLDPNPATGESLNGNYKGAATELNYYIYERDNTPRDYMSVIITGLYKNEVGYYKIVLVDANGTLLNIIRNHRYILTIVGVSGYGHTSYTDALNSAPSNALKVQVTDNDPNLPFIAVDGQYRLAMSNNAFTLYGSVPITNGKGADEIEIGHFYCNSPGAANPVFLFPEGGWPEWFKARAVVDQVGDFYRIIATFKIPTNTILTSYTASMQFFSGTLSLPFRVSFVPSITPTFMDEPSSYRYDLVDSADKNWNIRIVNSPSEGWLGLRPSTTVNPMVSELSSKYNSHAYLYVKKGASGLGTVWKTSVSGGEPAVTKISIIQ